MRRARALAALAVIQAAIALGGCGDGGGGTGSGDLRWEEEPQVVTPETLPDDRIASGVVRNDSLKEVDLTASDLRVVDSSGDDLRAAATFNEGFGRSYFSPSREPLPEAERERVGQIAKLAPGESVPLTVSWTEGPAPADSVDYGGGLLPLP